MVAASSSLSIQGLGWERLSRLRDALDLIAAIRELRDPFASPEEFRKLVSLVVRLADQFGVDPSWLERWNSLLSDEQLIRVVLAIAQYVVGILSRRSVATQTAMHEAQAVVIDAQSYGEWLPLVIELLQLVLRLRGDE